MLALSLPQVLSTRSESEFQDIVANEELDFRFVCGYQSPLTFSTRDEFVHAIVMHFAIYSVHAELTQLKRGIFENLKLGELAGQHPIEMWSLLAGRIERRHMTAADLEDMFEVEFSPIGSNNRVMEETLISFLYEYFQLCEGEVAELVGYIANFVLQHYGDNGGQPLCPLWEVNGCL